MLYRNQELERAFEFIAHTEFDLFCLQEVPKEFLSRLQSLPYELAYARDTEKVFGDGETLSMYNVILSKHPISAQTEIAFRDYWEFLPWRSRFFVSLMRPLEFSKVRNRAGLHVDITPPGSMPIRVMNLHLILAQPLWRLEEFEHAMIAHDASRPTIICGDFNILESLHVTILNWMFGGRFTDAFLYRRERTRIEERFIEHKLTNILRGQITHPFSRSQLDHILVSHSFSVKTSAVLRDGFGSDHRPVYAEIE
jgi:endonuclease/exonuclease/phosphatase family metal-dependent hydrolase